eukprot:TRINITY_DN50752_c0_g1_i1.p1 TRINITY_DN50752_c0_g1~~TRINITY_DN50752_c0_g1_i1.p1  ORF type:complete len:401 (-),score=50.16 TRINITY_DN50752_c0_g1_i1:91-1293(-)
MASQSIYSTRIPRNNRRARHEAFGVGDSVSFAESSWAPKWRRLLEGTHDISGSGCASAPSDFVNCDRLMRGMLNRISTENASILLPLDLDIRHDSTGSTDVAHSSDWPDWFVGRLAAHMVNFYLYVVRTNRCARAISLYGSDNVLAEYLKAVGPIFSRKPRALVAIVGLAGHLLGWPELCWPTTRLLLLASRNDRDRMSLPGHSLGRLPPDIIRGRILRFIAPPGVPSVSHALGPKSLGIEREDQLSLEALCIVCQCGERQKDVVNVLAHLVHFAPASVWPWLSSAVFALVEAALMDAEVQENDVQVYIVATLLVAIVKREEKDRGVLAEDEEEKEKDKTRDDSYGENVYQHPCMRNLKLIRNLAARLACISHTKLSRSVVARAYEAIILARESDSSVAA